MHIFKPKTLAEYYAIHTDAATPMKGWRRIIESRDFKDFNDFKSVFGKKVDYVAPFMVFDVGGNNYRIVTIVEHPHDIYIRYLLTHREYDDWTKDYYKGKHPEQKW